MKAHELAKQLLSLPDMDVSASCDIETGVFDEGGDEVIAKLFADGICEVFSDNYGITIQFESSCSGGEGVDVIEVVREAQKQTPYQKTTLDTTLPYYIMCGVGKEKDFKQIGEYMRKGTDCFGDFKDYMLERNGIDIEDGWYIDQNHGYVKFLGSVGEVAVHYKQAYNDALNRTMSFK